MWVNPNNIKNVARCIVTTKLNSSLIIKASLLMIVFSLFPFFAAADYTNTTYKCIACHNDTGYPADTDGDGVAAPYKRPHNNNTMCESCHGADPHKIKFIQPDGTYGNKISAASCPACHQTGIPTENNTNFTGAIKIPLTLRHSSDPDNGSVWGSYWNNANPKEACIYCHNSTLHDILPLGRILEWYPEYIMKGPIGSNYSCAGCHYKGSANYSEMNNSFTSDGLSIPPEITNGTNWNGKTAKYFNHSLDSYTDEACALCHGGSLPSGSNMSEFLHNVSYADMNNCLGCHRLNGPAPKVDSTDLGAHIDLNLTEGSGNLTSEDCRTCHFNDPHAGVNFTNTYYCFDCHNSTSGGRAPIRSTIKFEDKRHGEVTCVNCHVADGNYHQGNPRGSVANATYVARYSSSNPTTTDCADCHRAANLDDAPFYAPGGGTHIGESCISGGCHGPSGSVVAVIHRVNALDSKKPYVSAPVLDQSTVTRGTNVNVSATVNFTLSPAYGFALVDGAQYRIMEGTTEVQSWTQMTASDGNFDTIQESAIGMIDTDGLAGTYDIEVRGMGGGPSQSSIERYYPMNGDISDVKSVILTVQPLGGYINGTISDNSGALEGVLVSTTGASDVTGLDGKYSLIVPPGTFNVTASKQPAYNDNTTSNVVVTAQNTSFANMTLSLKPTGNISGTITN